MLAINGVSYDEYEVDVHNRTYGIRLYGKNVVHEMEVLAEKHLEVPVQVGSQSFVGLITKMNYQMTSSGITVDIEIRKLQELSFNPPRLIDCKIEVQFGKPKKENKMLKIKDATLVNGTNAESLSEGNILEKIEWEEKCIEKISTIKAESKALSRIKEQHESNIKKLVEILDSRE